MKLMHLLEGIDIINLPDVLSANVSNVCYAADKCEKDSLFVAITGLKYDGHDFIEKAMANGARFIVHDKDFHVSPLITALKVANSRRALGILAKNYFANPSANLTLVAVIGTNGKTTITYLLEEIFKNAGFKCGVLGTVNYRYSDKIYPAPNTTPESYEMQKILREMADDGVTHIIAEVSSHAIDLRRVDDCDFDLGVFTNLTPEHLDYHLTMENYFQAKKRFFAEVLPQSKKAHQKKMIINGDDSWGKRILQEMALPAITYGLGKENSVKAISHELSLTGIKAKINLAGETIYIETPLIGKFNVYNILAACAVAIALQISPGVIKKGIESLSYVPGRLEKINTSSGINVFVDYAHKADALKQVLQNLAGFREKRIITVFGCGGNRDRGKRPLMGKAATDFSDLSIVTSDNPRLEDPLAIIVEIENGIDRNKVKKLEADQKQIENGTHSYMIIPERKKAIEKAISLAQKGDIILIAGKGHEDYQIMGTNKTPFDDRVVARQILALRGY